MKTIRIGDGKYAIVITDEDKILKDKDLQEISTVMRNWWESDDKFIILAEWGNLNIRFERMDNDQE